MTVVSISIENYRSDIATLKRHDQKCVSIFFLSQMENAWPARIERNSWKYRLLSITT